MESKQVGLIGLGVMGQSLALNIEDKGFAVSVYNITKKVSDRFLKERVGENLSISGYEELQDFVLSLDRPRRIIMMITAGAPIDEMIEKLKLLLDEGDVLLDGGNSYFKDTSRRMEDLNKTGIHYLGVGISGGEEGALKGPSLMPGGSVAGWELSKDFLTAIAAKCFDEVCCSYIGDSGSGHFVKMVHNGIEYADMQSIAEAYKYMSTVLKMTNEEISCVFEEWNQGPLKSYLIEITIQILLKQDPETKESIVELISDVARQKGTGKWTSKEALDLGVSIPSLTESVYVRYSSMKKDERAEAFANYGDVELQKKRDRKKELEDLEAALRGAKISIFSQGFAMLKEASDTYNLNLNLSELAKVWMRGCIIRADLLKDIQRVYENDPATRNLLLDPRVIERYKGILDAWRRSVMRAVEAGVPFSVIGSSLTYFDVYRSTRMSTNLIQAQRDYFGAHTYERIDRDGSFHTDW
jgi:6-phosphogluconate dehydrogenase